MTNDFDAHKTLEQAHEHGGGHASGHGPRWMPIVAAVLAVLAAVANLASNQRTTQALLAKNAAILTQAKASDTWSYYQAKKIKLDMYAGLALTKPAAGLRELKAAAKREAISKEPLQRHAQALEHEVEEYDRRSEALMKAHETMEVAVTLFEIAIVLISISTLVASGLLTGLAIGAAGIGIVVFAIGFLS